MYKRQHPYRAEINKYLKDSFQLLIEKSSSFVHKVIFKDANRFHHIAVNIRRIQDIRHQRPPHIKWKDIKNCVGDTTEENLHDTCSEGAHGLIWKRGSVKIPHVSKEEAIKFLDFTLDRLLENL